MSDKPLPPELRFLIEAERSRSDAPADAKAIAEAKLSAVLGPIAGLGGGGPGQGAVSTGTGSAATGAAAAVSAIKGSSAIPLAKLLAVFAVGGLAGGGLATAVLRPAERIVYVERAPVDVSPVQAMPQGASAQGETASLVPSAVSPVQPIPQRSTPTSSSAPRSRDADLAAERAVIERARSALARGDAQAALLAIAQHQRDFPSGQLNEEREALAVQALGTAGRAQEATERGARFRKSFPNSLLLPLVNSALR